MSFKLSELTEETFKALFGAEVTALEQRPDGNFYPVKTLYTTAIPEQLHASINRNRAIQIANFREPRRYFQSRRRMQGIRLDSRVS
jgi:hypothetical protein